MAGVKTYHPEVIDDLALALVTSSTVPILLLDGNLTVIAASASFCSAFQVDPRNVPERELSEVGKGEWDMPQLRSMLRGVASGYAKVSAYEMDLRRKDREPLRLVLSAVRLDLGETRDLRLLLTVSDITYARAAEALRVSLALEKTAHVQEIQHRVANSLQVIASVLLQSARHVQSEETRDHLHDAHQRVLSIAEVQKRLAVSTTDDVKIRPYFTQLCDSLGASMIVDHHQVSLDVHADGSARSADDSMSLGLIVTELVINSLKHAFPDNRKGKIVVDYQSHESDWTLSVSDNGAGMDLDHAKAGLGTSIIEALGRQLHATQTVVSSSSGTTVSIVHGRTSASAPNAVL